MTKRGKICIVIKQYKYSESNKLQDWIFRFRVTNEKCNVSFLTDSNVKSILGMTIKSHNHNQFTKKNSLGV